MASAAYLALLQQRAASWILLALATGAEELHGDWTSEGSGAYSRTLDPFTTPAAIRSDRGLYRSIVGVQEDATALTAQASLAAVKANPGSHWYDEPNRALYVHMAGSGHPDSSALAQALFQVRLATRHVSFTDQPPFRARLTGKSVPSIRMERPDILRGISVFPDGSLSINNADGLFDYLAERYSFINADLDLLLGGEGFAYGEFEPLPTMQIAKLVAGDNVATMPIRALSNVTNRTFPQHSYWDGLLPTTAMDPDTRNKYQPQWWGVVQDVPVLVANAATVDLVGIDALIEPSPGNSPGFVVTGVRAVGKADGAVTDVSSFFADVTGKINTSGAPTPAEDYDWWMDGYRADAFPSTDPAFQTGGAIAQNILENIGVPSAQINAASFVQAAIDNPAVLGLWTGDLGGLLSLQTAADLLNQIERSTLSSIYKAADGRWTMQVWNPVMPDLGTVLTLRSRDLLKFAPVSNLTEHPVANIRVRYNYNRRLDTWQQVLATSVAAAAALGVSETDTVDTCLVYEDDARTLAARLQLIASRVAQRFAIETGPLLMNASVGDKLRVIRGRGPSLTGSFDKVLEIESITKQLAGMRVQAVVSNMRGLGEAVKQIAPDGTPDWASASAEQKRQYIYIVDDATLRADPSDPSTYMQHVMW